MAATPSTLETYDAFLPIPPLEGGKEDIYEEETESAFLPPMVATSVQKASPPREMTITVSLMCKEFRPLPSTLSSAAPMWDKVEEHGMQPPWT